MAGLLWFEKFNNLSTTPAYVPPFPKVDPLTDQIDKVAANLRSVEQHFALTSLATNPHSRTEKQGVTSLETVTVIVQNFHVLTLSAALKTEFTDQRQLEEQLAEENSSGSSPVPCRSRRAEDSTFLLDQSRLEAVGLDTSFLPSNGNGGAVFNIYGTPLTKIQAADSLIYDFHVE